MSRYSLSVTALLLLASAAAPRTGRADEFRLKDGSTIVGTVVGYEGNSFKVKTSYGFALVEKDKIVSIKISNAAEAPAEKKIEKKAGKPAAEKAAASTANNAEKHASIAANKTSANAASAGKAEPGGAAVNSSSRPAGPGVDATPASVASQPARPSTAGAPPATVGATATGTQTQLANAPENASSTPPGPQPIRERISGNRYINDTYDFQMYKPPDWEVMDGARSVLPGAVAAMGTDDQSTYLVVGQETAGKSAAADNATMVERLNEILVNYRATGDEQLTISGEQAVAHRFRGSMDEHDWSGFMVFLPRGAKLYTIFGMTRADNDLVQIQENVIRRTIASFQFLPQ